MGRVAALLAAALLGAGLVACGGGGAEPGAPRGRDPGPRLPAERRPLRDLRGAGERLFPRRGPRPEDPGALEHCRQRQAARLGPRRLRGDGHQRLRHRPRARPRPGPDRRHRPAATRLGDRPRPQRDPHTRRPAPARPSASPACPRTTPCSTPSCALAGSNPSDVHRVTIGFNAVADLAAGQDRRRHRLLERRRRPASSDGDPDPGVPGRSVRRPAVSRAAGGGEIRLRGSRLQADRCAEPRVRAAWDATPIRP